MSIFTWGAGLFGNIFNGEMASDSKQISCRDEVTAPQKQREKICGSLLSLRSFPVNARQ
jgi:hypothetical protein